MYRHERKEVLDSAESLGNERYKVSMDMLYIDTVLYWWPIQTFSIAVCFNKPLFWFHKGNTIMNQRTKISIRMDWIVVMINDSFCMLSNTDCLWLLF